MTEIDVNLNIPNNMSDLKNSFFTIISNNEVKSLLINKNSFLSGFIVSLNIRYKNKKTYIKAYAYDSSALNKSEYVKVSTGSRFSAEYIVATLLNTLSEDCKRLELQDAESVTVRVFLSNITPNAVTNKVKYVTPPIIIKINRIVDVLPLFKTPPNVFEYIDNSSFLDISISLSFLE